MRSDTKGVTREAGKGEVAVKIEMKVRVTFRHVADATALPVFEPI